MRPRGCCAVTHVFVWNICTCERVTYLWCSHLHGSAYKGWAGKRTRSVCLSRWAQTCSRYMIASRVCLCENMNCIYFFSCDQKPWGLMGIVSLYLVLHFWFGTVGGKTEHIFDQSHTHKVQSIRAVSLFVQPNSGFKNMKIWIKNMNHLELTLFLCFTCITHI